MQRHGKVDSDKSDDKKRKSNAKWWIVAGVSGFIFVCVFVGITLWLGLSFDSGDSSRRLSKKEFITEEVSSARLDNKQVVLGAASHKSSENNQQTIKKEENKKEYITTVTTDLNKYDDTEEALVEEVPKTTIDVTVPTTTSNIPHKSEPMISGSPLHPQPIPETPTHTPENQVITEITNIYPNIQNTTEEEEEHISSIIYDQVPFSRSGMTTEETDIVQQILKTHEKNPSDYLDRLFQKTANDHTETYEEEIANAFLGGKDIRRFDLNDAVSEKGEHFMPQHFEYPHDRDHLAYDYPVGTSNSEPDSLIRDREPVITVDGVDREGIPSLDHDDGLFYSPSDPEKYDGEDPDMAENPFTTFLQGRLQELYNWLSTDEDLKGKYISGGYENSSISSDFMTVLVALNRSINEGNSSILLQKLKDMYYADTKLNVTDPTLLHNSSSLVSIGLLAFDLLLLRNVQQIAWEEDKMSSEEMMKDPEVLALNALFMPPEKVRQLQEPSLRVGKENKENESNKSILQEFMEFVNGSLRAVLNLGRAYRNSVASGETSRSGTNTLDCIWTLYCRNLDKTASMHGPYGFLAKMNSLGLRLVMGEFPVETALDQLVREVTQGWTHIDCEKLFPRCSVSKATEVVMNTALGVTGGT